jgi:hypothetical protein
MKRDKAQLVGYKAPEQIRNLIHHIAAVQLITSNHTHKRTTKIIIVWIGHQCLRRNTDKMLDQLHAIIQTSGWFLVVCTGKQFLWQNTGEVCTYIIFCMVNIQLNCTAGWLANIEYGESCSLSQPLRLVKVYSTFRFDRIYNTISRVGECLTTTRQAASSTQTATWIDTRFTNAQKKLLVASTKVRSRWRASGRFPYHKPLSKVSGRLSCVPRPLISTPFRPFCRPAED